MKQTQGGADPVGLKAVAPSTFAPLPPPATSSTRPEAVSAPTSSCSKSQQLFERPWLPSVKNIPFPYREEDFRKKLLDLVPLYALNYHRKKVQGTFQGLAFANFAEARHFVTMVIQAMRQHEIQLEKKPPSEILFSVGEGNVLHDESQGPAKSD